MSDNFEKIEDLELKLLLDAIAHRYHYDFHGYSRASIKRRLKRALAHFRCTSLSMLQDRILHNADLLPDLIGFLTVQVSEMFRDPAYFLAIRQKIVPHLKTYPSLKVWVAGCSAGEELYSFVILFREEGLESRTMFYATDINQQALQKAQNGVYDLDRIQLFSQNHQRAGGRSSLSDFYTAAYGAATFDKTLRQRVVFSDHSLVSDEVFAEMQLISCRNVLIYFDRPLQDRSIGLFSASLSRKGFLGLGSKETLRFSGHAGEFDDFSHDERLFQKSGLQ